MSVEHWWNYIVRGKKKYLKKNMSSATLSISNLTRTVLRQNMLPRDEGPANDCEGHDVPLENCRQFRQHANRSSYITENIIHVARVLRSFGMRRSADQYLVTVVSKHPVGPIFKGQARSLNMYGVVEVDSS
jgi:hypothetical protein